MVQFFHLRLYFILGIYFRLIQRMTRKEMNWNFKKLDQFLHAAVSAMRAKITEEGSIINFFLYIFLTLKEHLGMPIIACENIRFSSLFVAEDVSSARNVLSDEERGEKDVFAGY